VYLIDEDTWIPAFYGKRGKKNMDYLKLGVCAMVTAFCFAVAARGQDSQARVYVWNFTADKTELNDLADKLTLEFEEALAQSNCYQVLERRDFPQLIKHATNENEISSLSELSRGAQQELRMSKAQIVIFGKVLHDVKSGEYRVSTSFQRFDSTKEVSSIRIRQGRIDDAATREQAMRDLIGNLCSSSASSDSTTKNVSGTQPQPTQTMSIDTHFFTFKLLKCSVSGQSIICDLQITSNDRDKELIIYAYHFSRVFDDLGNEARSGKIRLANEEPTSQAQRLFVFGVPTAAQVRFEGISPQATKVSLLEMTCRSDQQFKVQFRNICLTASCKSAPLPSGPGNRGKQSQTHQREQNLTVNANQQWTDTGIDVVPEMKLEINASGTVNLGSNMQSTPLGVTLLNLGQLFLPLRKARFGALIAKIRFPNGKYSPTIGVGMSNTLVTGAAEQGRLLLGINDSTPKDNSGSYTVNIRW
jgi:hypothetical protein